MKGFTTLDDLDEYRTAEKFFREKMSGHWTKPTAEVAMVAAIRFLLLLGKPAKDVRHMVERTIAHTEHTRMDMPTGGEIIRMTGQE